MLLMFESKGGLFGLLRHQYHMIQILLHTWTVNLAFDKPGPSLFSVPGNTSVSRDTLTLWVGHRSI